MYQLCYKIETLSPVLLTQISGDMNMVSTLDYIPGTVVQGIFAKRYIKEMIPNSEAHEDPTFYEWFLNSGLIFTNAYIADEERNGQKSHFFPTPFSINEYKIDKTEEQKNKAFDLMIIDPDKKQKRNVGPYCLIEGSRIFTKNVTKSINFHHSRGNRLRGHSEEGTIFNYESLDTGQTFAGRILGSKTDLKQIKTLFENQGKIRIGRSKNTQYGDAKLTWFSSQPEEYRYELQNFSPDELYYKLTLTFLSPAIIYNECGFASTSISDLRRCLDESLNLPAGSIEILRSFKRDETVENFVGKWLLKKPSENSIRAGSCFEFEFNNPDQFDNIIKDSLLKLQQTGIGERTGEGFGRFAINLQKIQEYELHKLEEKKKTGEQRGNVNKPDGEIPELAQGIIKNVILNSYYTRIEAKALEDCLGFLMKNDRIPSNSLIGKMELMLRGANSSKKFMEKIESFPQLTKNKLDRCRNEKKKETLYSFLVPTKNNHKDEEGVRETKDVYEKKVDEILFQLSIDDMNDVCSLTNFDPKEDPESRFNLYSHYWITFLSKMRKERKKSTFTMERGEN